MTRSTTRRELPLAAVRRLPRAALGFWRRSLRTRVVTAIVVLCALVVGSVGWMVTRQIADGLVSSRVDGSLAEARTETAIVRERLGPAGSNDFDPETQLRLLVETLVARGDAKGFEVVVQGPVGDGASPSGVRTTPQVDAASVPASLRRTVEDGEKGLAWTYTRIRYAAPDSGSGTPASQPGVAVGSTVVLPADGGSYALYYLFPMGEEQQTLALLRQVLLVAGLVLLLLVAGVALLVTRQVITPVRLARRVAERIASGRLEERMQVTGEDDIARLATSFNQMAEALQSQIRKLVELSRVQRTFVSDVSHELRTPLTTVRMAGDVLHDAREGFDPVAARAAELLQAELDRFENLLADLLEISRFDAGAAVLDLEDANLGDVARRVVAATAPMAAAREVRVQVLDDGVFMAESDVRRVERIVRNLVTNAIDHADPSGVVVRLASDEETTALTVRDHGVGLQPGQSGMVFNRFWRADPARARTTGGTGLGLAIALEDARLHGGWLQAWGTPGGGAQFRLTLPRRAGEPVTHSPLPLVPDDLRVAARRVPQPATTPPGGGAA
ncbi:MtrAB system histidine kinase MtrB [Nocardioides aurantiacus]|uniref:Sensor histidine kinase MtrB n=1 Tax=Nocardioides aurantiacus TaxID=86796 RepID=A0A3N2CVP4_9ACTN|nr:MtrAB system histidine kinase MtrB [Nocardioides aurantiacus]ROR91536.1 two-component system sensor histidine kinase MtrB [Nocardioides aurantiacus]